MATPPETPLAGGCRCGAIRYEVNGAALMSAYCHCNSCRRATGAPVTAWGLFRIADVDFRGDEPSVYISSPGVRRTFCGKCGTPLAYYANFIPEWVDLTLGSLDEPERLPPALHTWESNRLPWLHLSDRLPRYPEFPPTE